MKLYKYLNVGHRYGYLCTGVVEIKTIRMNLM